jgi:hypothetical protein
MTKIEDMSETERQAWITLIVDVSVFFVFLRGMTTAWSIDTLSAPGLSKLVVGLIIITIILHIIIQSLFAVRSQGEDRALKDERDLRIERKGASLGFFVLAILLNIIIGHIVISNGLNAMPEIAGKQQTVFDYTNTSHLVFALLSAAFIGDIVKNASMILSYRRGG